MDFIECIYSLESPRQARFEARFQQELREHAGEHGFGGVTLEDLRRLELDDQLYGSLLFDSLFPPGSSLRASYRREERRAKDNKQGLRLRLHLSPDLLQEMDALQDLAWERIFDPEHQIALARSPFISFSRYGGHPSPQALPGRARLLGVVAAPPGLRQIGLTPIDRRQVTRWLKDCFQATLWDQVDSEFLEEFVTPQALRDRLQKSFQAIHLIAHGMPAALDGDASLLLQDAEGLGVWIGEDVVADIFLDCPELRLILLMSCFGAAAEGQGPFQGLAGRLVQRGLPAVIAVRRQISMQAAERFTESFYKSLAETGQVDVAVNTARMVLFLDTQTQGHWSDPVLFMALPDGRPWEEPATPTVPQEPSIPMPVGLAPTNTWLGRFLIAAAILLVLSASLASSPQLANWSTDAKWEPTNYLPLQISLEQSPTSSIPPAEKVSSPTSRSPEPTPARDGKPGTRTRPPAGASAPPVHPSRTEIEARIKEVDDYVSGDNTKSIDTGLRIYQNLVADLPGADLDQDLLRQAEEQVQQSDTRAAVRLYRQLLDAYLKASGPSERRNEP